MSEDYEILYEATCPKCGHCPIHTRDCTNFCEEGYFDEWEDDPVNFMPGESYERCPECKGTGMEIWCPECGENLSGIKGMFDYGDDYEEEPPYEYPCPDCGEKINNDRPSCKCKNEENYEEE